MPFDPAKLLAMPPLVSRHELTSRDTILYALGVGATELEFLYEAQLIALPTMAVVMAYYGYIWRRPEIEHRLAAAAASRADRRNSPAPSRDGAATRRDTVRGRLRQGRGQGLAGPHRARNLHGGCRRTSRHHGHDFAAAR